MEGRAYNRTVSAQGRGTTEQGFSLIEMLVTISVVGILASIAYPSYQSHLARAVMIEARLAIESVAEVQAQSLMTQGHFLESLTTVLARASVSSRVTDAFDFSLSLTPNRRGFFLSLTPVKEGRGLRTISIDHLGRLQSAYQW